MQQRLSGLRQYVTDLAFVLRLLQEESRHLTSRLAGCSTAKEHGAEE
jgi:hypothetical protein